MTVFVHGIDVMRGHMLAKFDVNAALRTLDAVYASYDAHHDGAALVISIEVTRLVHKERRSHILLVQECASQINMTKFTT